MFKKFIRRPVLSIVISLIIVFLGILSLVKLPVTQFPSISPPKVNITAEYPGANNELLIKSVIIPLERGLNGVPGMKYMTSDAGNDGEASIQIVLTWVQIQRCSCKCTKPCIFCGKQTSTVGSA